MPEHCQITSVTKLYLPLHIFITKLQIPLATTNSMIPAKTGGVETQVLFSHELSLHITRFGNYRVLQNADTSI